MLKLSLVLFIISLPAILLAGTLNSSELISNSEAFDGKLVTFRGEAIGDIMKRGNFAWVNLNDGENAIGIWMTSVLAGQINITGNYKARGDILEVTGIFNRACPEHGGDLDIHAQAIKKIQEGRIIKHKFNFDRRTQIVILLFIIFLTWILTLFKKK